MVNWFVSLAVFCLAVFSPSSSPVYKADLPHSQQAPTIILMPLGKVDRGMAQEAFQQLHHVFAKVQLRAAVAMPKEAYYAPRKRYRADLLIRWLKEKAAQGEVYVGLTSNDISTTKGKVYDWGVMGFGYRPGPACVVSSYRLKQEGSIHKIILHELGHTAGLAHCKVPSCYMRDAEGKDVTGAMKSFCTTCKGFLQGRGWQLR